MRSEVFETFSEGDEAAVFPVFGKDSVKGIFSTPSAVPPCPAFNN